MLAGSTDANKAVVIIQLSTVAHPGIHARPFGAIQGARICPRNGINPPTRALVPKDVAGFFGELGQLGVWGREANVRMKELWLADPDITASPKLKVSDFVAHSAGGPVGSRLIAEPGHVREMRRDRHDD